MALFGLGQSYLYKQVYGDDTLTEAWRKVRTDTEVEPMFVVVSYDISHNRRRTRLHRELKNFGTPVQYSVFECILDHQDFSRLQAAVKRIIRQDDRVRYYRLCEQCAQHVVAIGGIVPQPTRTLVV